MRKIFGILIICLALVLVAISIAACLPLPNYYIDILSQLRLAYVLVGLALLAAALVLRSRVASIVSSIVLILNAIVCAPLFSPPKLSSAKHRGELKIIAANVLGAHNSNYDAIFDLIDREQPHIVAISEMFPTWRTELRKHLSAAYPYQFEEKYVGGGMAIFSRVPIQQIKTNGPRRYGVRGVVNVGGKNVLVIASHPPAPSRVHNWISRNNEFRLLAADVNLRNGTPVVIVGDLNCTPFSQYFQQLLSSTDLIDSEQGLGPQPSWSAHHGVPLVPIDHCLYTPDMVSLDRRVGPKNGSDHLPVIVTLAVRD